MARRIQETQLYLGWKHPHLQRHILLPAAAVMDLSCGRSLITGIGDANIFFCNIFHCSKSYFSKKQFISNMLLLLAILGIKKDTSISC
jgi:hypothetical protein